MRKSAIFLFFLLVSFESICAGIIVQNPVIRKGKLDNGLTYYIYPNTYPKNEAVYRLFIKTGSENELNSQRGLAHFLEHMAFNGTEHFPGNTMVQFLESKGAKFGKDLNAHTSFNETIYKLQLPSSQISMVDSTLTILRDWACGLMLDSVEIENERGVILSEWLSRSGPESDVNNAFLMDLLNESRFSDRIVIGDTSVIRHFHRSEIVDYYQKWYQPQLMAVAVVGDIDSKEVEKMIFKKFGSINKGKSRDENYSIRDYNQASARVMVNKSLSKIELNMIQLLPAAKPVKKEKDYPAYLESVMLNRLMKARLNALSFENPTYQKASISLSDFLNVKRVLLSSVELNPREIQEGLTQFITQINQIYKYGFLNNEIEKQKKIYLSMMKRKVDSSTPTRSDDLMNEIYADFYKGNVLTSNEEEYRLMKKYIQNIDSVRMLKLIRKMVDPHKTRYVLNSFMNVDSLFANNEALLNYVNEKFELPVSTYGKYIAKVPDQLLENEPVAGTVITRNHIPEIDAEDVVLNNGVRVIFRRSVTDKDKITISAFRTGGTYALDSTDYVTGLIAGNIVGLSGAGAFSREMLSQYLAGNSASVRFLIDKTRSGVIGSANLSDIETLFELLYLKWSEPRVDSTIFKQTKDMSIKDYLAKNRTEETRYYEDLSTLLKKKDYTTRDLSDTVIESEMQLNKVLPVFNQSFGDASGYTFVVIADDDFNDIEPYILQYIGGLKSENEISPAYKYNGGEARTSSAELIRKASVGEKATVSMIFQRTDSIQSLDDFNLLNEVLSGVLKMKLLKELREKMGMVYSVGVSSGAVINPSTLSRNTISFKCLPENVDTLISTTFMILKQMELYPSGFESELNDVKTNLLKTMKINVQKDSFWSTYIRNTIFNHERDWNYVKDYENSVSSITSEQISLLIRDSYNKNKMIKSILLPK